MVKSLNHPERKSPRLQGFDYAAPGSYFVTICVQNRLSLFGNISNAIMNLNPAGEMVNNCWRKLGAKYSNIVLADQVAMPNHFHGVITIENIDSANNTIRLTDIISEFKTMTTSAYIRSVKEFGWQPFEGKLWQRSYHDHIIRDERDMLNIQQYIAENPARWQQDKFYVAE